MKKYACGAFILFLFIVNAFIDIFIMYYIFTITPYIDPPMIYLFCHAFLGVLSSAILFVGLVHTTLGLLEKIHKFFKFAYYPYIASHFIGIIYYSIIIGDLKDKNDQLPYRIFIFYFMINIGVFWWTFSPTIDVIKDKLVENTKKKTK